MGHESVPIKRVEFDFSQPSAVCNILPPSETTFRNFFSQLRESLQGINVLNFLGKSYHQMTELVKSFNTRRFIAEIESFLLNCIDKGEFGFLKYFIEESGWDFGLDEIVGWMAKRIVGCEDRQVPKGQDLGRSIHTPIIHILASRFTINEAYILTAVKMPITHPGRILVPKSYFAVYRLDDDSVVRGTVYDVWDDSDPCRQAHDLLVKFLGNKRIVSYLRKYYLGFGVDLDLYKDQ